MDNDISLKREMFALNIRRDQRDRKMREIREIYAKLIKEEAHKENFDEIEFQKYKELCRKSSFTRDLTEQAFEYLFSKNITSVFSNESNLKFIFQFSSRVNQQKAPEEWEVNMIKKINENIKELIKREISLSPKDNDGFIKATRELDDLSVIKKCFNEILNLATSFGWHFELLFEMSIIRNKDLKNEIFLCLKSHFTENYNNLSSKEVQIVIYSMENLYDDLKNLSHEMIHILETLLLEYDLGFNNIAKIIDFFVAFLETDMIFQKIKFLIEDTSIYENLIQYLSKEKNPSCYELVSKLALFIFKMYSPDDEQLCQKVYLRNPLILNQIRSWLPLAPSTTTPRPLCLSTAELTHTNFCCIQNLISALTNICASGPEFMSLILTKCDIYFEVISLFHVCPVSCREEIALFARNCIYSCDKGIRKNMIDGGFVEFLIEMIREQGSKNIIEITLGIILWMIRNVLEDDSIGEEVGYSRERFIRNFESLGGLKEVEFWCDSEDSEITRIAGSILNVIKE